MQIEPKRASEARLNFARKIVRAKGFNSRIIGELLQHIAHLEADNKRLEADNADLRDAVRNAVGANSETEATDAE